jgi:hypothetical protein
VRAVRFGGLAASEFEGGWRTERGVRCWQCRSRWSLMVVAPGVYHCDGPCEPARRARLRLRVVPR